MYTQYNNPHRERHTYTQTAYYLHGAAQRKNVEDEVIVERGEPALVGVAVDIDVCVRIARLTSILDPGCVQCVIMLQVLLKQYNRVRSFAWGICASFKNQEKCTGPLGCDRRPDSHFSEEPR